MFGDRKIAFEVAYHFFNIDAQCRQELSIGTIVSEREYVSILTYRIRAELAEFLALNCHAQTLPQTDEIQSGADDIIVFRSGNKIKAGLFEAKRPRVLTNDYRWDYLNNNNQSHFSDQIRRQSIWSGQIALWEMFLNEAPDGFESPPYENYGSSCVWHKHASAFTRSENLINMPWTTRKLKELLGTNGIGFNSVIYNIIMCNEGKVNTLDEDSSICTVVSPTDNNISLNIPIPISPGVDRNVRVEEFLTESNLSSYLYVDLKK